MFPSMSFDHNSILILQNDVEALAGWLVVETLYQSSSTGRIHILNILKFSITLLHEVPDDWRDLQQMPRKLCN